MIKLLSRYGLQTRSRLIPEWRWRPIVFLSLLIPVPGRVRKAGTLRSRFLRQKMAYAASILIAWAIPTTPLKAQNCEARESAGVAGATKVPAFCSDVTKLPVLMLRCCNG